MISRRFFLQTSSASLTLAGIPISGYTADVPRGNIVVIILEGGMDGIMAVPPIGDPSLRKQRKVLMSNSPIKLNPFFALHPSLGGFAAMMADGDATVVHATSFPYVKRSHFEGQNIMESGNLAPFSDRTGWVGRALDLAEVPGRALSMDMPLIVRGSKQLDNYYPANLTGAADPDIEIAKLLMKDHDSESAISFKRLANKYVNPPKFIARDPVSLAKYAGKNLQLPEGPSAAVIRVKEFDTHANQGADDGQHSRQLSELDDIFLGLKAGLQDAWDNTVILTLTEFGRTVKVNGTEGTDHGYGSAGLLAGGLLKKGQVLAQWPGLRTKDLFEKRDLQATIDYRSVCAACIEQAYGIGHDEIAERVFYEPKLARLTDMLFV
jgi:uncharacterized protein (DUF1501 family)